MAQQEDLFKKVVSHCKEYGFVFPSSEIYDGLGAVYDYGQLGSELKNNIKRYWWEAMTLLQENVVGIDSAIFMHPTIWKASGHVDAFNDPLIDNKDSKKRYRADVLIEDHLAKIDDKIAKEIAKAAKRFGESFDEAQFRATNARVLEYQAKRDALHSRFAQALNEGNLDELRQIILDNEIVCPISGTRNWTEVRQFNLMFSTEMGSTADGAMKVYLRPETAQGIFVNYLNVQKTGRMKIPFGIAQIGKAFRNEIVARQFIFRMREFEQMELQFFVRPGEELRWFDYWKQLRLRWHLALGLGKQKYRYHDHEKLAHYANAATDIEFEMPFGFKEVEGIHSRTDFDLKRHEEFSGKKLQYFDPELGESYVPYVVETSIGVDRMFLSLMCGAYDEEALEGGDSRVVLHLPAALAPIKLAVLPLVRKDGLDEQARQIYNDLRFDFNCAIDEKDSIGKRYRRQDAIGTPYCITVDHQTLEDGTVTLRHRDTMQQERIAIDALSSTISAAVSMKTLLKKI
ncbi:glycine--tRNA ligase [Porphyromonas sp. COT-239 OH1446]|uniref:glycine--tRNA ligase n=1 Tax=Porphyromonas sp. COT-239 OH1446 TaxID=1515613 RepID=UPI00052E28FF|nr:glycine--tRNA ligase [Porphyromonas sp. COT-239 OH1446]KGN67209.1 glycyl-tRNA synthetease [Porphyromonas sp. COT-239 OH1446]